MAQPSPRERLNRLVDLASEPGGPARRELTNELADLLLDWPSDYPAAMREPFEALLERALEDIDPAARALLAERFAKHPAMPLSLINLLLLDAPPDVRIQIVSRNAASATDGTITPRIDEVLLLFAIRGAGSDDIPDTLARQFRIQPTVTSNILGDRSAHALAILCKGAQLSRATFSAVAVMAEPTAGSDEHYRRLAAYDSIPEDGARAVLSFWQKQAEQLRPITQAA